MNNCKVIVGVSNKCLHLVLAFPLHTEAEVFMPKVKGAFVNKSPNLQLLGRIFSFSNELLNGSTTVLRPMSVLHCNCGNLVYTSYCINFPTPWCGKVVSKKEGESCDGETSTSSRSTLENGIFLRPHRVAFSPPLGAHQGRCYTCI